MSFKWDAFMFLFFLVHLGVCFLWKGYLVYEVIARVVDHESFAECSLNIMNTQQPTRGELKRLDKTALL